ncbi:TIR domain-containing protein [Amycolatopsis sp. CB00013]|uniref:TIR domain-containing protein n=1 Tax=Amycolatopsis sp. CB00013 TaxID=1703945 RepID=UPI0009FA4B24|nr:nucleotide-binding protein [Amycolatopsis sp. CB00013]
MDATRKIELIEKQIEDAKDGRPEDFRLWREKTEVVLRNALGDAHPNYKRFLKVKYTPSVWTDASPQSYFDDVRERGVRNAVAILQAALLDVELSGGAPEPAHEERAASSDVFIVHGQDEARKHEVARFIQKLTGNEPKILHEQANSGQTIIEKFEEHAATAAYAVVIATGDDLGRAKVAEKDRLRARQNVVFELGFFFGKLGRSRVAFLYEENVELPSDINGVVYISLDPAGAWKAALAREMESAGVGIDWSALR